MAKPYDGFLKVQPSVQPSLTLLGLPNTFTGSLLAGFGVSGLSTVYTNLSNSRICECHARTSGPLQKAPPY